MKMARLFSILVAAMSVGSSFAMSLADARAALGAAVNDQAVMAKTVSELSAKDQVTFVGDVNAAIAALPGDAKEKTLKALVANRAILNGARKGNVQNLLAEMFAKVPADIVETFAVEFGEKVLNRASDPSVSYTDAQYNQIADKVLAKVMAATASADEAMLRNGAAVAMLVKASNGSPAFLADRLYEKIGASEELRTSLSVPGPMVADFVADQFASGLMEQLVIDAGFNEYAEMGLGDDMDITRLPRTVENMPWNSEYRRKDFNDGKHWVESRTYDGQVIWERK